MFPALKLGRLFGIPLFVHWTFWLLPLWMILTQSDALPLTFRLAVVFALFGCVILHELGHALAARYYGIRTRDITLYPIGGIASLQRISEKPVEELVIAIAGPAVNVVIAMAIFLVTLVANAAAPEVLSATALTEFLAFLLFGNVFMVLFNMIPAFPLDGGRVFRALLGFFLPYLHATRVAVYVGTALTALLMITVVAFWPGFANPFLFVIAFFVFASGQTELAMLQQRERLRQAAGTTGVSEAFVARNVPAWLQQPAAAVYVWDPHLRVWVRQDQL